MARKFRIEQDSGKLRITYAPKRVVAIFVLIWGGFWTLGSLSAILGGEWVLFPFVLMGLVAFYYGLSSLISKKVITVDRNLLTVDQQPLPAIYPRRKELTSRDIRQLYVDKSSVRSNNQPTYNLIAILSDGREITLVGTQQELRFVQDLEKTIETYMDITDDPTLNLSSDGRTPQELREAYDSIRAANERIGERTWVPEFIREAMRGQEEVLRRQLALGEDPVTDSFASTTLPRTRSASSGTARGRAPKSTPLDEDRPVTLRTGSVRPRPLPAPGHDVDFPLFARTTGDRLRYRDRPYRIGRTAQLDWRDDDMTTGRQLELRADTGDDLYVYAQIERERWTYHEERRLDDAEVSALGFTDTHPLRFNNGDERYYPRDRQEGHRFVNGSGRPVEQYIYFTTSASTLFRALKTAAGWEVYVMEPVDAGSFAAG